MIASFDGRPIRFADAVVTPRVRSGRYEFVVASDADTTQVIRVDGVIGGGHMEGGGTQGFVTRRTDGTYRFVPFDWSRGAHAWFCNTNSRRDEGWVPITPALRLADCGDWPPVRVLGDIQRWANCQGCHASQLREEGMGAARRTQFTSLAINCESCHGPARRHVELAERGALTGSDIGIAALATRGKDASLDVCFQCHAVKDKLRDGFVSGDSLALFYSIGLPALGERPLQPDGRVRTFAYQEAHRYSECYVSGGMTCTACHDPHSQGYRTVTGTSLLSRFDDRQCTSCHPSKAVEPTRHTHHPVASPASRCTSCHMPYLQQPETTNPRTGAAPIRYMRSDHSIAIPRPLSDSALGIRNACVACHANRSAAQLDEDTRRLWGPGKPMSAPIIAQLRNAGRPSRANSPDGSLLHRGGDVTRPRAAATIAGVARYLEQIAGPGEALPAADVDSLTALANDPDLDVRALALATLHIAARGDRSVRQTMVKALVHEGGHDFGLRVRWALALGYKGDQWAEQGRAADAERAYRDALELQPDDAALWNSLGNATRGAGDPAGAARDYEDAIRFRPDWGLARVNLAIAQLDLGDRAASDATLRMATEVDPSEPLAWFNLGNSAVATGALDDAVRDFDRSLAIAGGPSEAYFQLARVALLRKDPVGAYGALRRGLSFDSSNAPARALAHRLQETIKK